MIESSELSRYLTHLIMELYSPNRNDLNVKQGCLMFADRRTTPRTLRPNVLKALYCGHPGTTRLKPLPHIYVYQPLLDRDIKCLVPMFRMRITRKDSGQSRTSLMEED
ncbi:unnamed protein product [Toxocara canis]|uniref:DUF4485 domain-containing protein n=1 Tax=Toxocara canis TaxID=6265 RepID=A0A183UVE8_TOXCA|nr:unnamed protein product [Toxocara canis]